MTDRIRRIHSGGGEFEAKIGYCRAVVAGGGFVHVAGTVGGQGDTVQDQCRAALDTIKAALDKAGGASLSDAVRVNYYLPDRHEFEPCWSILAEPSATTRPPRPWWNAA